VKIGFIGWRGMVGSVLLQELQEDGAFGSGEWSFFSTSNSGGQGPSVEGEQTTLIDAHDLDELKACDLLLTCQGGDYTRETYPRLRATGWNGYWLDAASALRLEPDSVLVLDPVNRRAIEDSLAAGIKTFVGANCTVSLLLLGVQGLIQADCVEWISSMTYQAASGAGARQMEELVRQMDYLGRGAEPLLAEPGGTALTLEAKVRGLLAQEEFPAEALGAPLAASALPWIDSGLESGQTREEWKAMVEANKLLGRSADNAIPMDGVCVRVGAMRSHAQALTIKLKRDVPLSDVESLIASANEWVDVVPNDKEATLRSLTPVAVAGTRRIAIGRLRKMRLGERFLAGFTVGDQLLWGAATPLCRMVRLLRAEHGSGV